MARTEVAIMSVSAAKQSAIGSAATVNRRLNGKPAFANNRYDNYNDRDEARGQYEGTGFQRIAARPFLPFDIVADDISTPLLLAYALGGGDTLSTPSGGTNARQHTLGKVTALTELPFATVQYNRIDLSTVGALKNTGYIGCAIRDLTLGGRNTGELRLTGNWAGSGATQNGVSIAALAGPSVGTFIGRQTFCAIGTGMAGSWAPVLPTQGVVPTFAELANPVDWSPYLIGWSFQIRNTLNENIGHAGSLNYNAGYLPLTDQELRLVLTMRWEDSVATLANLSDAQQPTNYDQGTSTPYPSMVLINKSTLPLDTGGTVYSMAQTHVFPRMALESAEFAEDGGITIVNATFLVSKDTTNNPYYGYCWNKDNQAYGS